MRKLAILVGAIISAFLAIAVVISLAMDRPHYATWCPAPSEDSRIVCSLDPSARYTYDGAVWMQVPDDVVYRNGNRPPTGADLTR